MNECYVKLFDDILPQLLKERGLCFLTTHSTTFATLCFFFFLQCLPVATKMVAGKLALLPLSAVMLMVYSMPGVRPLRV